jgi:thymidine kinase
MEISNLFYYPGGRWYMSKLYFRYGAMNCGKSTNLLQVAYNYEERGMRVMILKPQTDLKGGNTVISRLGVTREVDLWIPAETSVTQVVEARLSTHGPVNCILADEVQFFSPAQINDLFEIAVVKNIPVICYGLRTDFRMNGFSGSERLLLLAHSIEELKTICTCGKKAILNGRKINGLFVFEGEQVAIDGMDQVEYQSLCPKCYFGLRDADQRQNGEEQLE